MVGSKTNRSASILAEARPGRDWTLPNPASDAELTPRPGAPVVARLVPALALLAALSPAAQATPPEQPARAPADAPGGPPVVSAKAWAVADGETGAVLWGADQAEARPIASTTKVMTASVVLRAAAGDPKVLDEVVTFSDRAATTPGSSARLLAGDRVPVGELLYGLLLPSGNDAAVALAEHFGPRLGAGAGAGADPVARFVGEMNRRAKALGLKETGYADPNGLSPENKSSARDLARLTHEAMKDARFRGCVAARRHEAAVAAADGTKRTVVWANTNRLLDVEGYDGVKTGTTTPAGNCLVARGRRGDSALIVVVLGATSADGRTVDARNLFRWAWGERERAAPPGPAARPKDAALPKEGSAKPASRTTRAIEGWAVRVDDRLLTGPDVELGTRALRFLEAKLIDVKAVVSADRVRKLQAVPIVLDLTHGGLRSMQYHPSAEWLTANGYAPDLAKCVHLPRAADVATRRNVREQPWVVLHELAHAYHDRVLGFDDPRVRAAYEGYKRGGRGDRTLAHDGARARHYALTDHKEFFAEMTESYFGANDFFPFNRAELRESEPDVHELMAHVWDAPPGK